MTAALEGGEWSAVRPGRILPIILPDVLYGCETWSLTLREERKLRVFENTVLRRILDLGGTR